MTVRFGRNRHSANTIAPTRNVLPTWRGMLIPVPPIVAAYLPSARLARISRPTSGCQGRNRMPSSAHLLSTEGQPVDVTPFGATTCRAISESRGVERFVGDFDTLGGLLVGGGVQRLDLLGDLEQPARERSQVAGRAVHVLDLLGDPSPQRHQQFARRASVGGLRDGLRLRLGGGLLVRRDGPEAASCHAGSPPSVEKRSGIDVA